MTKKILKGKILKGGGVSIEYRDPIVDGSETYGRKFTMESTVDYHPDLKNAIDALKAEFASVTGFTFFVNEMMSHEEFKATAKQSKVLEQLRVELFQRIKVNGISLKGTEEKPVVVILGSIAYPKSKAVMAISPKIELSKDEYGFEQDLSEKVETVVSELVEYMNGKKSQLDIPFEE